MARVPASTHRLLPLLLAVVLGAATACTGGAFKTARGVLVDVQASGLIEWESITVRTDDRAELTFLRGQRIDLRFWRASHLRDHMATGARVRVEYDTTDQGLIAVAINDASSPTRDVG